MSIKWMLGVKSFMVKCGMPIVYTYFNFVSDSEFKDYIKRQFEDLANQSWYTMLNTTSLCDCYMEFKHGLFMGPYLRKLKAKHRIQLSRFRCAPYMSSGVREKEYREHTVNIVRSAITKVKQTNVTWLWSAELFETKRKNSFRNFFTRFQI